MKKLDPIGSTDGITELVNDHTRRKKLNGHCGVVDDAFQVLHREAENLILED